MMKTTKKVLSGTLWMARGTATMVGFAVMLAVVLGVGTTALAAAPGDPFKLGRTNTIDGITKLIGSASEAMLRINNNGSGPALDLRVEEGEAPMNVNSATRVNDLNADQLDGKDESAFFSGKTYVESVTATGSGGGALSIARAFCDPEDEVLSGGGGPFAETEDDLKRSGPNGFTNHWELEIRDNGDADSFNASVLCADFPPLR